MERYLVIADKVKLSYRLRDYTDICTAEITAINTALQHYEHSKSILQKTSRNGIKPENGKVTIDTRELIIEVKNERRNINRKIFMVP